MFLMNTIGTVQCLYCKQIPRLTYLEIKKKYSNKYSNKLFCNIIRHIYINRIQYQYYINRYVGMAEYLLYNVQYLGE